MRLCSSILACISDIRLSASIEAATVANLASAELPRSRDCIMRSIGETNEGIINAAPSSPAGNFDKALAKNLRCCTSDTKKMVGVLRHPLRCAVSQTYPQKLRLESHWQNTTE